MKSYRRPQGPPTRDFDSQVAKGEGCWIWTGSKNSDGYGVWFCNGDRLMAHRASFERFVQPIPDGLLVRHTCDNPPCVNPQHLLLGTNQDNIDDAVERRRNAFGQRNGSAKLTEDQVLEIRRLHDIGGAGYSTLARRFGVSKSLVRCIVKQVNWKHLPKQGALA